MSGRGCCNTVPLVEPGSSSGCVVAATVGILDLVVRCGLFREGTDSKVFSLLEPVVA